jgi:hypothetical protein
MNNLFNEIKENLETSINELKFEFENYDFSTPDGLDKDAFSSIETFEAIAKTNQKLKSFPALKKLIKSSLFSTDEEDYKLSEFDWDTLEDSYEEVTELYENYMSLLQEVEDNLTGDLTVDTAKLLDAGDLMNELLKLAIDNDQVYEINHPEHGVVYLLNDALQKKLEN